MKQNNIIHALDWLLNETMEADGSFEARKVYEKESRKAVDIEARLTKLMEGMKHLKT